TQFDDKAGSRLVAKQAASRLGRWIGGRRSETDGEAEDAEVWRRNRRNDMRLATLAKLDRRGLGRRRDDATLDERRRGAAGRSGDGQAVGAGGEHRRAGAGGDPLVRRRVDAELHVGQEVRALAVFVEFAVGGHRPFLSALQGLLTYASVKPRKGRLRPSDPSDPSDLPGRSDP